LKRNLVAALNPNIPAPKPPPGAARRRPDPAWTRWPGNSACPPAPSRSGAGSGTTPELSVGSDITTKAKSSISHPDPTRSPAIKDAGTTPSDLHERHLATNRSEEVQYATRGFCPWRPDRRPDHPRAVHRRTRRSVVPRARAQHLGPAAVPARPDPQAVGKRARRRATTPRARSSDRPWLGSRPGRFKRAAQENSQSPHFLGYGRTGRLTQLSAARGPGAAATR
jgi:hypothetical protein